MDATGLFIVGIAIAALLAAAAVFTVAYRRGPGSGPVRGSATGKLDSRAVRRDLAARRAQEETAAGGAGGGGVATLTEEAAEEGAAVAEETEPQPDPILERRVLTPDEFGMERRRFFNRAILGLFGGAFLGGLTISFLAFLWPKLGGGFGTPIAVGSVDDLRKAISLPDGTFSPSFFAAAQTWIVPWDRPNLDGTSFEGLPVMVGASSDEIGVMALWQRCVHLGCRVPFCGSSQGFECPCHGSKYNLHGEYQDGPAPRNLDRFGVETNARGELVVLTGEIFRTPRAKVITVAYPQGPNCV